MFFTGTIFLEDEFLISYLECEKIVGSFLSSFRLVPHNVSGIPPTLWLTMWQEYEEIVSLNDDAHYHFLSCMNIRNVKYNDLNNTFNIFPPLYSHLNTS